MYFVSAAVAQPVNVTPALVQQRAGTVGADREPLLATRELKDLRILLAEDNSFNVMVAQDELEFTIPGVKVDVASNGKEAVDLATKNTYDVVLMDVQMPGMDGYQATRAIRALPGNKSRLPIVALTANVMQAEVDRCMEAGMNAFVPKPFKREELMKALQEVLSQTRPA
jgi:CheY-like chemotaxis protein